MVLLRYHKVVAIHLHMHSQAAEGVGDDAQIGQRHVFDAYAVPHHGCHPDERAHLYHVGQHGVRCAVQGAYALNGEQVAAYARNLCAHGIEQTTELLYIGFAGSIVDGGLPLCQHSRHDDVGGTCDRSLI